MQETRTALTEKLEALEQQVADSVQTATSTVAETVATVKETVDSVKETVQGTVENVKDTVAGTVENVKESVADTVTSVKETLDIQRQFERHPWGMFLGSVAAGFFGARLVRGAATAAATAAPLPAREIHLEQPRHDGRASRAEAPPRDEGREEKPGWFQQITGKFSNELDQLKGLALAAAIGVARDMVKQSVPAQIGQRLADLMNDVTEKMGARPIAGEILGSEQSQGEGVSPGQQNPAPHQRATGKRVGSNGGHGPELGRRY